MKKYALLGKYENNRKCYAEIIAASDNCDNLRKVWDVINKIKKEIECKERETPDVIVEKLIKDYLRLKYMMIKDLDFCMEVEINGIYETQDRLTMECTGCGHDHVQMFQRIQ